MDKNNQKSLMNKRETDWFRGIAALMVVLSHYGHWWNILTATEGNVETFRFALTKLGIYGVDIFFLFSGYAMVKSLGTQKMNRLFIWKRIKNVFIPYLIVAGTVELISGNLNSAHDLLLLVCGYNYWYMCVLFMFYIGFIIIYALIRIRTVRVIAFSIFTYILSYKLYKHGMSSFWYVSNIAFAIGVTACEYETAVINIIKKIWIPALIILNIGMIFIIKYGLTGGVNIGGAPEDYQIWFQIGATAVWTLIILILAAKCRIKEKIFAFLGKQSIYIYLTHVYVFMRCINNIIFLPVRIRFILSPICIIAVSSFCSIIITGMWKLIPLLYKTLQNICKNARSS